MRIVTVVGARPQFIKAAVVSRALRDCPGVREVLVHTGQHYDRNMSGVFFEELGLPLPDVNLGIGSGPHGRQTGRMLEALEAVLLEYQGDWVLVYGDTNSTLAGALAAVKLHLPLAHVEAGLRSFNRRMPEELNRVLTDHAADLLFAPTATAVANLAREGIVGSQVHQVGDVMYDAARYYAKLAERDEKLLLLGWGLEPGGYVLATVHRAENTDVPERLGHILRGLAGVAQRIPVVLPLHPRTRSLLRERGEEALLEGLLVTEPLGYLDMVRLEKAAALIATDSGGIQKEAYCHGVPCVTLRDETEWTELVETGWNRLAPPVSAEAVSSTICQQLGTRGQSLALYGDGHAGEQIARILTAT